MTQVSLSVLFDFGHIFLYHVSLLHQTIRYVDVFHNMLIDPEGISSMISIC